LNQPKQQPIQLSTHPHFSKINNHKPIHLLKKLPQFESTIQTPPEHPPPHPLTNYLHHLAPPFHKFYNPQKLLTDHTEKTKPHVPMIQPLPITFHNPLPLLRLTPPQSI
ncbi:DALR anticodon-binding domain-containing protein, partial [Staphylococcus epidermidis]|uniref:DALR anticodon-binding domain-containing protein n=1 Tax=Staphylococcus epidermidis TaxID=1282 RepID=UPI0021B4B95F